VAQVASKSDGEKKGFFGMGGGGEKGNLEVLNRPHNSNETLSTPFGRTPTCPPPAASKTPPALPQKNRNRGAREEGMQSSTGKGNVHEGKRMVTSQTTEERTALLQKAGGGKDPNGEKYFSKR